jgi:predicted permease
MPVLEDTRADQVIFEYVTGNYFPLLGVRPLLGRTLTPDDDVPGAAPAVVISSDYWQSHWGGDAGVLDKPIRLNGQPARIVGVIPRAFDGYEITWLGPSSVWLPRQTLPSIGRSALLTTETSFFPIIGRMRPGVTVEMVRERAQAWLGAFPVLKMPSWSATAVVVIPPDQMRTARGSRVRSAPLFIALFLVSMFTLVAACFNISNFLIGRGIERRRELALRSALGASRARVIRQLFTEALLVGVTASVLSLVVTWVIARAVAPLPRVYLGLAGTASALSTAQAIDVRMVGMAIAMGLGSALAFGLIPAVIGAPRDPMRVLKDPRPHWSWSGIRVSLRQVVLTFQVAITITLAVTAGLYARTFLRVAAIDSGYANSESVLVVRVVATSMPADQRPTFYRSLLERLHAMPSVVSASIGWNPPFAIGVGSVSKPSGSEPPVRIGATAAAPRFFETQGIRLLDGREFDGSEADTREAIVINRELAKRLWPDGRAVGQEALHDGNRRRVIGVVADDRCVRLLGEPVPCAWQPIPLDTPTGYLRIRTKVPPLAFLSSFQDIVHGLSPDVAVAEPATLDALVGDALSTQRLSALASAFLAFFGIGLLAVGGLSLFQSMVNDSRREIAIRMALGATRSRVARRVMTQGALLAVVGTSAGLVGAYVVALRIADRLYGVGAGDLLAFVVLPLCVAALGLIGVGYSASSAARTEPARFLQLE